MFQLPDVRSVVENLVLLVVLVEILLNQTIVDGCWLDRLLIPLDLALSFQLVPNVGLKLSFLHMKVK